MKRGWAWILSACVWGGATAVTAAPPELQPLVRQYAATLPAGYGAAAVLAVEARWSDGRIVLSGRALGETERTALTKLFAAQGPVEDRIEIFPYRTSGERPYAVVGVPVADMRAEPSEKSELVSQALAGDSLKLIEPGGGGRWWRVLREWDGYVGWVAAEHLRTLTVAEVERLRALPHYVLLRPEAGLPRATLLAAAQETASVSGARPVATGEVALFGPDGRTLRIPAASLRRVEPGQQPSRTQIVAYARALLADQPTRYVWGGTADRALDCSGFNQTVFRLAGIALPRDSYQQQAASRPVAAKIDDWKQLQPGDLVFFSENGRRATHTGIYIGEGRYIHSSRGNDGIALNDLNGTSDYERKLRGLWWGGGRVLP